MKKPQLGLQKFLYITSFIAAAFSGIFAVQNRSYLTLLPAALFIVAGCREYNRYKNAKTEADKAEQEAERARRAYLLYGKDEPAEKE